jgi:AcrR family transcriptional regulator
MKQDTKQIILKKAVHTFAQNGYEGFSIRILAEQIPIAPSVVYHHFKDKDALLKEMFDQLNKNLGSKRSKLPNVTTASAMLRQRIEFQIDNQESIVAVLKYYLAYRDTFKRFKNGFVPDKSALHIEEVLQYGLETKEFFVENLEDDAKVITHAINGFLLEYYPHIPKGKEKKELVDRIFNFLIRALKGGENT